MNETHAQALSQQATTDDSRAGWRELTPAGETLSSDEIELVAGGLGCHRTTPIGGDDFTCSGGWYD